MTCLQGTLKRVMETRRRHGIQAVGGGVVKALRVSVGQGCPVCSGRLPGAKEGGLVDRRYSVFGLVGELTLMRIATNS